MTTTETPPEAYPLRCVPGLRADRPGMQIGTYVSDTADDDELQYLQQLDVKWAMLTIGDVARHTAAYYRE